MLPIRLAICNTPSDEPISFAADGKAIYTWRVMRCYLPRDIEPFFSDDWVNSKDFEISEPISYAPRGQSTTPTMIGTSGKMVGVHRKMLSSIGGAITWDGTQRRS